MQPSLRFSLAPDDNSSGSLAAQNAAIMARLKRFEDIVPRANEPQTYPADARQICPGAEMVGLENND